MVSAGACTVAGFAITALAWHRLSGLAGQLG